MAQMATILAMAARDGGGDDEGGTGVGAGISVNIIVAEDTKAAVEDNASLRCRGCGGVCIC